MYNWLKVKRWIENENEDPKMHNLGDIYEIRNSNTFLILLAILTGKNITRQEFVKIKSWLILVFSICLQNQLEFYRNRSIDL